MKRMAVDYFAVLGLERKAALEEEAVTEAFHALSREAHPDAGGGDGESAEFETVSEAFRRLKDPVSRLKHLLELEFPGAKSEDEGRETISGDLLEFFGRIGEAIQGADAVLKKKAESRTALGKAMLAQEEIVRQIELQKVGAQLNSEIEKEGGRMSEFDVLLQSDREVAAELGEEIARRLTFLSRWRDQVREKVAAFI